MRAVPSLYRALLKGTQRTVQYYQNDARKAVRSVFGGAIDVADLMVSTEGKDLRKVVREFFDGRRQLSGSPTQRLSSAFFVMRRLQQSTVILPNKEGEVFDFSVHDLTIPHVPIHSGARPEPSKAVEREPFNLRHVTEKAGVCPLLREFCCGRQLTELRRVSCTSTSTNVTTPSGLIICSTTPDLHYTIKFINHATSPHTLLVLSRHWYFLDEATLEVTENLGPGVVGQFPLLEPGEDFSYTYAYPEAFPSGRGVMKGVFLVARMIPVTHEVLDIVELTVSPTLLDQNRLTFTPPQSAGGAAEEDNFVWPCKVKD